MNLFAIRKLLRLPLLAAVCGGLLAGHAGAQSLTAATCPQELTTIGPEEYAEIAKRAGDRGLLYRIEKDGRTSWLFGTLHAGQRDWVAPGPRLTYAMRNIDTIALELDPYASNTQQKLTHSQRARPLPLPRALTSQLQSLARENCAPMPAFSQLHPVLQGSMLGLFSLRREGFETAYGQDLLLAAYARQAAVPVHALETPEMQLSAMIPEDAARAQTLIERELENFESGRSRRVLLTLIQAWETGDESTLANYANWCECADTRRDRQEIEKLLHQRNPSMAEGIVALHQKGMRVLAAVGALHMVGPNGLPKLLEKRGFKVQRIERQAS